MPHTEGLSASEFARVVPFAVSFDRGLIITGLGDAWASVWPGLAVGQPLARSFISVNPAVRLDFAELVEARSASLFLEFLPRSFSLRGPLLLRPDGQVLTFLAAPWITSHEDLTRAGLSLNDLPQSEALRDFLTALETRDSALENARRLTDLLSQQRNELRLSHSALDATRMRLEHLLSSSPLALFSFAASPPFGITFVSDNVTPLTGYTEELVRNAEFFVSCVHPDDLRAFGRRLRRVLEAGSTSLEYRLRRADGRYVWVREELRLVLGEGKAPLEVVGSWLDISARREAETSLEEREAAIRTIVDMAADGVVTTAADGTVRSFNAAATRIFGYTESEVFGQPVTMLFAPAPGDVPWQQLAAQTGDRTGEITGRRKDGGTCPLEVALSEARIGATVLTTAFIRDVSGRRRAEQTLSAQLAVTRVLAEAQTFEAAGPGVIRALCEAAGWDCGSIWMHDRRVDELVCASSWQGPDAHADAFIAETRALVLRPWEGLIGRAWAANQPTWVSDIALDPDFHRAATAAEAGLQSAFIFPIVHHGDGGKAAGAVELYSRAGHEPDRRLHDVLAAFGSQIGQFVERRQADEALRNSEERTRLIIDAALDAVISIDGHGLVRVWNAQATQMFGWTAEEAIGQSLAELIFPPQERQPRADAIAQYLATGDAEILKKRVEISALHRSGREFPIELAISPVREWQPVEQWTARRPFSVGAPIMFSAFVRDITAQRHTEAELRRAKDAAEAATRAKSEFLATMSHEIRTPMNGVIGMAGLLLETSLTEEQRDFAETIRTSAESLLTIINDILDFSKVEAGRLELETIAFSPADVIEEVTDLLILPAQRRGVELSMSVDASVPPVVVGDPGRFRQILVNLVGNAVKFSPNGEVSIRMTARVNEGDVQLEIAVQDTGQGLDEAAMMRLFQPFSQADSSMSRRFGGTGLGLAITRRLATLMQGEIAVESQPGVGSTFTAKLNMRASGDPAAPVVRHAGRDAVAISPRPLERAALVRQLTAYGFTARGFAGVDDLPALEATAVVIVANDTEGAETVPERLGAREEGSGPLTIFTTPLAWSDHAPARRNGYREFIARPVRPSRLFACLERIIGQSPEVRRGARMQNVPDELVHRLAGLRVLLAEDNPVNQKVASRMLARLGLRADCAADGLEALDAAMRIPYDVVLMDCQMPEMDGYAAAAEIRRREPAGRRVPIIAMTANAFTGERERCLEAGMDDYLAKPVRLDQLADVLDRWRAAR